MINYGFKNVKAVLASNILTLESIFALILAFIFYRELPNLKELFGGALIVGQRYSDEQAGKKIRLSVIAIRQLAEKQSHSLRDYFVATLLVMTKCVSPIKK